MPQKARLPLPSIVNPETRICVPVWVPNEDGHRAAFLGTLFSLAKAYNWENDEAHTAKDVAAVWLEIFNDASEAFGECNDMDFDVRQNEEEPCILEKSENDGVTWVEWANLQLCPPKIRFNRGVAQWFNPGSGLWEDVPGTGDEREDGTYDPPWPEGSVPEGQSAECLSAENILATYSTVITQARAGVIAGQFAVAISATVTGILGIFIPQAIISTIALALAGIALDLGEAGLDDMLTSGTLEVLRCNLYDHAESDGSFTASGYNAFYAQLSDDFSSLKLTALQLYFDMLGPVGLSRQGAANNIEVADCSGCDEPWCIFSDFETDDRTGDGWSNSSPGGRGVWVNTQGWRATSAGTSLELVYIINSFSAVYVSEIDVRFNVSHTADIDIVCAGGPDHAETISAGVATINHSPGAILTGIEIRLTFPESTPDPYGAIEYIEVNGSGVPIPDWSGSC